MISNKKKEKEEIKQKEFYYSSLKDLIDKVDKTKENVILLTTGSYNPINRMHLEILNIAYKY